jgi:hypothetical protein
MVEQEFVGHCSIKLAVVANCRIIFCRGREFAGDVAPSGARTFNLAPPAEFSVAGIVRMNEVAVLAPLEILRLSDIAKGAAAKTAG